MKSQWPNVILVHTPIHASWLNQVEIYFSIVQRKVLTPNDFSSLIKLEQRLLACQSHYEKTASPFQWTFTTCPGTFQASFQIAPYGLNVLYGRQQGRRFSLYVPEELVPQVQRWLDNGRALQQLLYQAASRNLRNWDASPRKDTRGNSDGCRDCGEN
jgi:hypothetical protein